MQKLKWLLGIFFIFISGTEVYAYENFCDYCSSNNSYNRNSYANRLRRNKQEASFQKLYPTYSLRNGTETMDLEVVPDSQNNYRMQPYYRNYYNNRNYANNVSIPVYAKTYEYNPSTHKRVYRYISNGLTYFTHPSNSNYYYPSY